MTISTDLIVNSMAAVSSIRISPEALRTVNKQTEGYAELVESVRDRGILNPISVTLRTDDSGEEYLLLVDGNHRFEAAQDAGLTEVPVYCRSVEDNDLLIDQIQGNAQRIETKPAEFSQAIHMILTTDPTLTKANLAKRLNRSAAWLDNILKLRQLLPSVSELVDDGKITLSNATALATLPEDEQEDWIQRSIEMSPAEFIPAVAERKKQIAKARREGKSTEEEFSPRAVLRKLSDIQKEIESGEDCNRILSDDEVECDTVAEAFTLGLMYAIRMDPVSVREQQEAFERSKEERKALRERNTIKRRQAKSVEAQRAEEKIQLELDLLRDGVPNDQVRQKLEEFDRETERLTAEAIEKALVEAEAEAEGDE